MIRVLIDECLPKKLKYRLLELEDGFEVKTLNDKNWVGRKNGTLLDLAQVEFDVLLTSDQHIPNQQKLLNYSICLVIIKSKSNRYEDILPMLESVADSIRNCSPGTYMIVYPTA